MNAFRASATRALLVNALRWIGTALFVSQFVLFHLVVQAGPALGVIGALESIAIWSTLFVGARTHRAMRIGVAILAATLLVLQAFVYRFAHTTLDVQVAEAARHTFGVIRPVLARIAPGMTVAIAIVTGVELVALGPPRRRFSRRVQAGLALVAGVAIAFGPDPRRAAADVRALHALSALRHEAPKPMEGAVALARLHSERSITPDVLFVLTESVRTADYVPRGPEATAAATAELTPGRFELDELRSISSYTAVSLSALITGRTQEGGREDILKSPNLFDFAHALGADVGYYSAQSRETFEAKDVRGAVDHFMTLETLAGHDVDDDAEWVVQPLDRITIDRFVAELPARPHPATTVLHLYGTHAPYYFDDASAKFTPFERNVVWSGMPKLRNAYRNAIVEQDKEVARAVRTFIANAGSRPWLIVFTSDHGEAFGEHGAIHHGQNLYDEQIHVPGWIAVSEGVLTDAEKRALGDRRGRFVTHLDLLPTVLDALGVLSNFSVRPYAEGMAGHSLLRPYPPSGPIPVTNCTKMFPCPLNTWGLVAGDHKLVAQSWDAGWWCLSTVGEEHVVPRTDPACVALDEASRRYFPTLPNGAPNRP